MKDTKWTWRWRFSVDSEQQHGNVEVHERRARVSSDYSLGHTTAEQSDGDLEPDGLALRPPSSRRKERVPEDVQAANREGPGQESR